MSSRWLVGSVRSAAHREQMRARASRPSRTTTSIRSASLGRFCECRSRPTLRLASDCALRCHLRHTFAADGNRLRQTHGRPATPTAGIRHGQVAAHAQQAAHVLSLRQYAHASACRRCCARLHSHNFAQPVHNGAFPTGCLRHLLAEGHRPSPSELRRRRGGAPPCAPVRCPTLRNR